MYLDPEEFDWNRVTCLENFSSRLRDWIAWWIAWNKGEVVFTPPRRRIGVEVELQSFLTSVFFGGGWSAPRPGRQTLGKEHGTHWIGNWMSPRASLNVFKKLKSFSFSWIEFHIVQPLSQSRYQLSYHQLILSPRGRNSSTYVKSIFGEFGIGNFYEYLFRNSIFGYNL